MKSRNRICSSGPKTVIVQASASEKVLVHLEAWNPSFPSYMMNMCSVWLQSFKLQRLAEEQIGDYSCWCRYIQIYIYRWVPLQYCPSCRLSSWRVAGSCALSAWTHPRGRSSQQSALHGQGPEVETWNDRLMEESWDQWRVQRTQETMKLYEIKTY